MDADHNRWPYHNVSAPEADVREVGENEVLPTPILSDIEETGQDIRPAIVGMAFLWSDSTAWSRQGQPQGAG